MGLFGIKPGLTTCMTSALLAVLRVRPLNAWKALGDASWSSTRWFPSDQSCDYSERQVRTKRHRVFFISGVFCFLFSTWSGECEFLTFHAQPWSFVSWPSFEVRRLLNRMWSRLFVFPSTSTIVERSATIHTLWTPLIILTWLEHMALDRGLIVGVFLPMTDQFP